MNLQTDYEVVYGSKRSINKLANQLMLYHRATYDANNETKVDTFIASGVSMENHVVWEEFIPLDRCH